MSSSGENVLSLLAQSLNTVIDAVPSAEKFLRRDNGITLLDVKNELFISYLQCLVTLVLTEIERCEPSRVNTEEDLERVRRNTIEKLVEYRVYLERGVRSQEQKLKYQLDKVIKIAQDAELKNSVVNNVRKSGDKNDSFVDDSTESDHNSPNSDDNYENGDDDDDELACRPNLDSLISNEATKKDNKGTNSGQDKIKFDNVYKPPRLAPALPPENFDEREKRDKSRVERSKILDEYVAAELSKEPLAEPSVGSTIMRGGERIKTHRQRKEEEEIRLYEESNFVRLPRTSKKDKIPKKSSSRYLGFGGEDWHDLNADVDRITRLTSKPSRSAPSPKKRRTK